MTCFFFLSSTMVDGGVVRDPRLSGFTDRHRIALRIPSLSRFSDLRAEIRRHGADGAVISTTRGLPLRRQIDIAEGLLADGYRALFYWPREEAIEVADFERIASLKRHWLLIELYCRYVSHTQWLELMKTPQLSEADVRAETQTATLDRGPLGRYRSAVDRLIHLAAPVFPTFERSPSPRSGGAGRGLYLRTDFWAPIIAGGSYGHTCHVAHELARSSESLVCVMANRFELLDELGLDQRVLTLDDRAGNELNILQANERYYPQLRAIVDEFKPTYIYERLCLGNYLGAQISQEFGIPYVVEYNGSEISMMRSFAGSGYTHEDLFLLAEEAAFRQATAISVISEAVRDDVLRRGLDPSKVIINPNGVSPDVYAPAPPEQKRTLRQQYGWTDAHRVIGFTGTFGGWHGIDVLAAALPKVAAAAPEARFLLIGDGNLKSVIDRAIVEHRLVDKVVCTGRVPQSRGAELLKACDIYVSPHASHMVDSRFFGSPTKLFEYMALGGGIVASDLEQLGIVLSPALRPGDLDARRPIDGARAILCEPGNADEFARAVIELTRHPAASTALGRNARQATLDYYSWERHVERLWEGVLGIPPSEAFRREFFAKHRSTHVLATGDAYKDETQRQWNADACGSHYVKNAETHTLEWYKEAEDYRYDGYAPWMPETMEFSRHRGARVLEVGGGMGTDLVQWARGGAIVTDLDLSAGHLAHAEENFRLRGLPGRFVHGDAEDMPFEDNEFDVVYANGVVHHSPHTERIVDEIFRVLRPGGRAIVMVYAEHSLHYWRNLVRDIGLAKGALELCSMGEIMSRHVEIGDARPLVKVYTKPRLRRLFHRFRDIEIVQRQITPPEIPRQLKRWLSPPLAGRLFGWNLVLKANKPR